MITTKQRAYLRSLANSVDSLYQIGKYGISDNLLETLTNALEARELIKITVQETCEKSPKELMTELCAQLACEPVQVIGRKIVVYRAAREKPQIVLPQ